MAKRYVENIDKIIMENADIVDFISRYIKLKKSGRNYKGLCPFHGEKTPSFFVSSEKQLFHCFGCNAGGNIINFVSDIENLGYIDSIEYIADNINLDLERYLENSEGYSEKYHEKEKIIKLNREAAIFYYRNLLNNKKALEYLKNRGINKNIIKKFGLGYALDEWNAMMDSLIIKGYSKDLMLKAGLVSKSSKSNNYYDKFRNRVMFPIFDIRGKIVAFGGRIIEKDEKAPKYLNSPETLAFNKSSVLYGLNIAKKNIRENNRLVLVEGYMDVIMLNKFGIKNVVAALGTSFTKEHARMISKYVDEIIICFDSDAAGIKATKRAIDNSNGIINRINVIELPEGYDPDDFINKFGKSTFVDKINNSKSSHMYLVDKLEDKFDFNNEYDLVEFMKGTKEILSDIKEYSRAYYFVQKISDKLDTPKEYVMEELFGKRLNLLNKNNEIVDKNKNKNINLNKNKKNKKKISSTLEKYEYKLLQYSLIQKKNFDIMNNCTTIENFNTPFVVKILKFLEEYYINNNEFIMEEVLEILDMEDARKCKIIIMEFKESSNIEKDINMYIKRIEIELLNEKIKEIKIRINHTTNNKEKDKLIIEEDKLKREIQVKTKKIKN